MVNINHITRHNNHQKNCQFISVQLVLRFFPEMATFQLQFWYNVGQLPESAKVSQEALQAFFMQDPNIKLAQMAFGTGPVGFGFASARALPTNGTIAGIQCSEIIHHINDSNRIRIYETDKAVEAADVK